LACPISQFSRRVVLEGVLKEMGIAPDLLAAELRIAKTGFETEPGWIWKSATTSTAAG